MTRDGFNRYAECTIPIVLAQSVGWCQLLLLAPLTLLFAYTGTKLYYEGNKTTATATLSFAIMVLTMPMFLPLYSYAVFHPETPVSTDRTVSIIAAIGWLFFPEGGLRICLSYYVVGAFQLAYTLEQSKAKWWTRFLNQCCRIASWGIGFGQALLITGAHFAPNQRTNNFLIAAGLFGQAFFMLVPLAIALALAIRELRDLQKAINPASSTGKTMKILLPFLYFMEFGFITTCFIFMLTAFIPSLRLRAATIWGALWCLMWAVGYGIVAIELFRLRMRKMTENRERQIMPMDQLFGSNNAEATTVLADLIGATKRALQSKTRSRRDPSASLVIDSGVSLAFLELFVAESRVDQSMTANTFVNAFVKPHTAEVDNDGSGAYVELIANGEDENGHRYLGTPTHMLSYSWSYPMVMMIAALRKFEHEHPPSKAQSHY
jgi:hypothetical protein